MNFLIRILRCKPLLALCMALLVGSPAQAQTVGPIYKFVYPWAYYALAATGEPVQFVGTSTFESQLISDPVAGQQLLVNVYWTDVKGTAYPSLSTYVVTGSENVMMPNAATQTMEVTFPMIAQPGSKITTTRTGVASFTFAVNTTTGAVLGVLSGIISIK